MKNFLAYVILLIAGIAIGLFSNSFFDKTASPPVNPTYIQEVDVSQAKDSITNYVKIVKENAPAGVMINSDVIAALNSLCAKGDGVRVYFTASSTESPKQFSGLVAVTTKGGNDVMIDDNGKSMATYISLKDPRKRGICPPICDNNNSPIYVPVPIVKNPCGTNDIPVPPTDNEEKPADEESE